jgi:type III secretory pathway lipoprotein EscJ
MPSHELRIKDMYSAAILRSLSYRLIDLDRSEGNYVLFVFDDPKVTADQVLKAHWDGGLQVNSRDFVESIRELKTRLYGANRY